MGTLTIAGIIEIIVGIIVLICFFCLCADVSQIKFMMKVEYNERHGTGKVQQAMKKKQAKEDYDR